MFDGSAEAATIRYRIGLDSKVNDSVFDDTTEAVTIRCDMTRYDTILILRMFVDSTEATMLRVSQAFISQILME